MTTIRCQDVTFTNIKAIIFDKDGTLENSQNFLRELGQRRARMVDAQIPGIGEPLLMAFGILDAQLDPTGLMAVGSRRDNEIATAAYIAETGRGWFESLEIAHSAFEEAERYLKGNTDTSPLFAGSLEVLKFLAEANLKLAILSADSTAGVKAFIERHQLSAYIQLGMGVETQGLSKPDPALFLQACDALGVEAAQTLMIGDSAGDIEMASKAGAAGTIGICWGEAQTACLDKADVAIASLDELEVV
ncbi:MAG: HAD family hydrolase [Spirulinaceae cyanobacterium]